ncbi:hypothetical protein GGI25_003846 [Coemansia spiralis]|uniref:Uncharacterized protein n=2 Tax=Coemansia TaxID=4863 RepID=A0A9W8KX61_9FUNG|nr:hypothetical protein BX070DRAFT_224497 [Coemansia spiralis]KAJ1990993.1 hypothetical protein EDC05_003713 [Coemansia umbellata]KAJ2621003.1 hypothetical protein GGI26_004503 [Coemansia sp. RSA 1358]KAJ2675752.1 hypothetical protein GGI25_003846 [Coemansia spiralis]
MDEFVNSIKSEVIHLDNLDNACAIFNIPTFFWYKNTSRSSWEQFMPPDILKIAFYKALIDFPILAGYIKTDSNGSSYIEINKDNLNMPEYTDTDCDVDFEALRSSGYNTKLLPNIFADKRIPPAPPGLYGGHIKMAAVNIFRLKDFSGVALFISTSHCAVDGHGYCSFVGRWAEMARSLQHLNLEGTPFPECTFIHNRSFHHIDKYNDCNELESSIQNFLSSGSFISRWMSRISSETRGRLFKGMSKLSKCKGLYFHISKDTLATLRESMKKYAGPDINRYSDNDILSALIIMTIGQDMRNTADSKHDRSLAKTLCSSLGLKLGNTEDIMTMLAVDMRPRLGYQGIMNFMGNLAFSRHVTISQDVLDTANITESLLAIASSIRLAVDSTNKEYVRQYKYMYNKEPDCHIRHMLHNIKHKNKIMISSRTRFPYYKMDFGAGDPAKARPMFLAFPNVVVIMPCHPEDNGYELAFSLSKDMVKKVLQNKLWMSLVDNVDNVSTKQKRFFKQRLGWLGKWKNDGNKKKSE